MQQFIFVIEQFDFAIELIQITSRGLDFQVAFQELELVGVQYYAIHERVLGFQISLPVQIRRLHVTNWVLLWGVQQHHVAGNYLVVGYFYYVACFYLLPLHFSELLLLQPEGLPLIHLHILRVSFLNYHQLT